MSRSLRYRMYPLQYRHVSQSLTPSYLFVGISFINHEISRLQRHKIRLQHLFSIGSHPKKLQITNGTTFEPFGQEIDQSAVGQDSSLHTTHPPGHEES
jgi:hypothetical protein